MIEDIPFFSSLNEKELKRIEEISTPKQYKKEEFLFIEGQKSQWLNIILKGAVKIYKTTPTGKEIFLHTIYPISLVAELVNFEKITYPASGLFLCDSEVLRIDYEKFEKEFLLNPKICFALLKSISHKLKIMENIVKNELILKSDAKVAKFIFENPDFFSSNKHIQIASILNIAPETLSRVISSFKRDGLIKFDDNLNLVFIDNERLLEYFKTK